MALDRGPSLPRGRRDLGQNLAFGLSIVNGQIGVGHSKYVVVSDPLPTGHVTLREQ